MHAMKPNALIHFDLTFISAKSDYVIADSSFRSLGVILTTMGKLLVEMPAFIGRS